MEPFWNNNPALYIGYLARNLKQSYETALEPYGLTGSLYFYLLYVDGKGGCSLADLSRQLHVDKAYVTRTIRQLETSGYILRRRNPDDNRAFLLETTDSGKEILDMMKQLFEQWNMDLKTQFSEEEYQMLQTLLTKAFSVKSHRPV
ncbi:MAG: MarR family transcriptional regulator [Lachnospiraceae bacterium]|nr:MarR family transcriptional regulator [Lachnospiraceae bacterium]